MLLPLALFFGAALIGGLIVSYLLPAGLVLMIACATTVFQVYTLPIAGIYLSISVLGWLALWPASLPQSDLWKWPWMKALAVLIATRLVSMVWSPNPVLAVRYVIYSLPMLFAAHAVYVTARRNPELARRVITLLLATTTAEAMLTICFRVSPALEFGFLRSPLARIFISTAALQSFFTVAPDNVFDPAKAGGFFLNANVAAVFLGVCAVSCWGFGVAFKSVLLRSIAVLNWVAVLFAGSKAGIIFAIIVPTLVWAASFVSVRRFNVRSVAIALPFLGLLPVAVALFWDPSSVNHFQASAADTLRSREAVWGFARVIFPAHPLLGLGFGGWEKTFPVYGITHGVEAILPPHNSALIIWSQSGLPALIAAIAWIGTVLVAMAKCFYRDGIHRQLALYVGGAFLWYISAGMGENFGFLGEVHLTPAIGVYLGYMCALYDEGNTRTHEAAFRHAGRAVTASTVPAV